VISALGSLVVAWPRVVVHAVACGAVALAASLPGGDVVRDLHAGEPEQDLLAVAQRLDLADGSTRFYAAFGETFPSVTPVLRSIGHYPFGGGFDGDCGLLGQRIPPQRDAWKVGEDRGSARPAKPIGGIPGAVQISGRTGGEADCVVVVGRDETVVGMGVIDYRSPFGREQAPDSFLALAPAGQGPYAVHAIPDR
jgi:hypothetical protein